MDGSEKTSLNVEQNTSDKENSSLDTFTSNHSDKTVSNTKGESPKRHRQTNYSSSTLFESSGVSNNSLTDITSTFLSSSTFTDTDIEKSKNITKELIVKKQFLHDIQKLKIELSQKNLFIDALKADHSNSIDDLEEKLSDAIHNKQLMQAKFEAHIRMTQNESKNELKRLRAELQESLNKQKMYQTKYQELSDKNADIKADSAKMDLTEDEYLTLKGKPPDTLSASEYFALKLYDSVHPLRVQVECLEQRINLLASDLRDREDELIEEKRLHADESHKRAELDGRCQRFQAQVEDLQTRLARDTYRNQNYDLVQGERDALERQITDLEKTCTVYKAELDIKANEMEMLRNQVLEQSQSHALLKQDKEYLNKQLNELIPRHNLLEEKYEHVSKQLEGTKIAREELYEKYLNSREHYKQEYETRMKRELEELTTKTNNELNKIKEGTKEMYERENRNLRESKTNAITEQERLTSSEKELQLRYNQILAEYRQLQISSDSKISESQSEVKLRSFELDRIQLLYEESLRSIKEMGMQNDLLSKKLETLNKEYYIISGSSDKRISEVEANNKELRSKLTIYEKLEQELDDVVMQAAEIVDEGDAERVLFAYGYGANVPSTAKRRMQQSVHLARRVLQLERANTSLRHDIERETKKNEQLADELQKSTSLLNEAQQPYNYLIDSIRTRDEQSEMMKKAMSTLEDDFRKLKEENSNLKASNNHMTTDLERLLNQREEMSLLKQVVLNLKSSNADESLQKLSRTASTVYGPHVSQRTSSGQEDVNTVKADPVLFTKSNPPAWFEKLKRQNKMKESSKSLR